MELREIKGIVLRTFSDELFKFTYIKFLTNSTLENIKIPLQIDSFKLNHVLNPNFLLEIEIIRTRKNWILKNVLEYKRICDPKRYIDFIKQSEVAKLTLANIQEEQEVGILDFVIDSIKNIENLDLKEYEKKLLSRLGF
ncbi:MAG: hypothetical protein H7196_03240 [candidate division SR1 bacterium]|nr:hypothetical protein [candidate division SR1 bacterium]